jgi:hypothetical protein
VSVTLFDDYIQPFYMVSKTVNGCNPADFSKAAFLASRGEFPEVPMCSANEEFLKCCFGEYFKQP